MPSSVQATIPDLRFSSHIFASDPEFRMINVNGDHMREGDLVQPGLKLIEITENGAVFAYLHYRFEIDVVRDWSYN